MDYMKKKQLCLRYQVTPPTIDKWVRLKILPAPFRCGRVLRWKIEDLEKAEQMQARLSEKISDNPEHTSKGKG